MRRVAWLIAAWFLAFLVRAAFVFVTDPAVATDEVSYVEIANNYIATGTYRCDADTLAYGLEQARPPLLPWLLIPLIKMVGGDVIGLRLALAAITALIVLPTAFLAIQWGASRRCAAVCAIAVGVYPPLAYYGSRILTEALTGVLVVSVFAALAAWQRSRRFSSPLAAGVFLGLTVLCRPTPLPFIPLLAVIWLVAGSGRSRLVGCAACLAAVVTLLPWEASLYRRHGAFIPVATSSGLNFWYVSSPGMGDRPAVLPRPPELLAHLRTLSEPERDAYYRHEAWRWARQNPGRFLQMRWACLTSFWKFWPSDLWNRRSSLQRAYGLSPPGGLTRVVIAAAKVAWYVLQDLLMVLAALKGRALYRTRRAEMLSVVGLFAVMTAAHVFVNSYARYRYPLDPLWLTLAVMFLCSARGRQTAPPAREVIAS